MGRSCGRFPVSRRALRGPVGLPRPSDRWERLPAASDRPQRGPRRPWRRRPKVAARSPAPSIGVLPTVADPSPGPPAGIDDSLNLLLDDLKQEDGLALAGSGGGEVRMPAGGWPVSAAAAAAACL